jgi:hypothetical protein
MERLRNDRGDSVQVYLRHTVMRPIRLIVERQSGGFVNVGYGPEGARTIAQALMLGADLAEKGQTGMVDVHIGVVIPEEEE